MCSYILFFLLSFYTNFKTRSILGNHAISFISSRTSCIIKFEKSHFDFIYWHEDFDFAKIIYVSYFWILNWFWKCTQIFFQIFMNFSFIDLESESRYYILCLCQYANIYRWVKKKLFFPSISYYFHIPKNFLNFFPHTGKNRNRRKSNLLP